MEVTLYYMQLEDKYWGLFLVALFLLFGMAVNRAGSGEEGERFARTAVYGIGAYLLFICPLTHAVVTKIAPALSGYYELSHMELAVPIIALAATVAAGWARNEGKEKFWFFLTGFAVLLFFAGDFVYMPTYTSQTRANGFAEEQRQAYEMMLAHGKDRQDDNLRLWAMEDFMAGSRLYDDAFSPVYGKDMGQKPENYNESLRNMYTAYCTYDSENSTVVNIKEQLDAIGSFPYLFPETEIEYVVVYNPVTQFADYDTFMADKDYEPAKNFAGLGYECIGETENYLLFYRTGSGTEYELTMIVIQIFLVFIYMCVMPYFTGCLFVPGRDRVEGPRVAFKTAAGLMVIYCVYEVLTLLFLAFGEGGGFRLLSGVFMAVTGLLSVGGFFFWICEYRKNSKDKDREKVTFRKPDGYMIAAICLILIQIGAILIMATPDKDDAFYSGLSSMSLAHDYLLEYNAYSGQMGQVISARYKISALPLYQATLSLFAGNLHHLFITHNLFPLFYMPLAYGLFYRIGSSFLAEEKIEGAEGKFLFCFALLHMVGNYYVFSPENFLVTRIWQGKALFVAVGVPFLWHYGRLALLGTAWKTHMGRTAVCRYWFLVACALIAFAFMGETGLFLGPFMLGCLTLAFCIGYKKWKPIIPAVICCLPPLVLVVKFLI